MKPQTHLGCLAVLLTGSVAFEAGVLSGLWQPTVPAYHLIHLALMGAVLVLALLLHRGATGSPGAPVALWFAAGLAFTAVGDYVNSALSPVDPVATKLSWALLFFGLGYSCYIAGLWKGLAVLGDARPAGPRRWIWLLIPVILAVNVTTWFDRIRHLVEPSPVLFYGSFVFNATLYVLLPWLAIRYLLARGFRPDAVLVVGGTVLLAYSDLVLFDSWLTLPAGAAVPTALYAANWIVYFGGQCLVNVFPAAPAGQNYSDTVP